MGTKNRPAKKQKKAEPIKLPTHTEAHAKLRADADVGNRVSALEAFIWHNEPTGGDDEKSFRAGLADVLTEATGKKHVP